MTDSLTRTLVKFGSKELVARYFDRLTSQDMDELFQGAMFMTGQAVGSDVGAIDTTARFEDGEWRLYGDKWFCSNPDAALGMVLARPEGGEPGTKGLSLFLLPRHLPEGRRNAYRILRLKEKMGTKSIASGEIALAKNVVRHKLAARHPLGGNDADDAETAAVLDRAGAELDAAPTPE